MIYRIDQLSENNINPITGHTFDASWMILTLTDSAEYQQLCGCFTGCAYTIRVSRFKCAGWQMAVCDFIDYCRAKGKNAVVVMSEADLQESEKVYTGHRYNDPFLRDGEPSFLIHSTPMSSWQQIRRDGMLKSWNRLKSENHIREEHPIGIQLGDPTDFSDYIMFGGGVTGEIVVSSRQQGKIAMDENAEYLTGARLYFDAKRMAQDGLILRDGCHLKVEGTLPLEPYLIWAATWDVVGLKDQVSTPKIFSEEADNIFRGICEDQQIG